jgi:hypothetical protein
MRDSDMRDPDTSAGAAGVGELIAGAKLSSSPTLSRVPSERHRLTVYAWDCANHDETGTPVAPRG